MQLTKQTDYSLRILLYLAERPGELVQTQEICVFHDISKSLVTKLVSQLTRVGLIESLRGRYGGGIRLLKDPENIIIADIVREFEPNMDIVECFNDKKNACRISTSCKLKSAFGKAKNAFLESLEDVTLASLL